MSEFWNTNESIVSQLKQIENRDFQGTTIAPAKRWKNELLSSYVKFDSDVISLDDSRNFGKAFLQLYLTNDDSIVKDEERLMLLFLVIKGITEEGNAAKPLMIVNKDKNHPAITVQHLSDEAVKSVIRQTNAFSHIVIPEVAAPTSSGLAGTLNLTSEVLDKQTAMIEPISKDTIVEFYEKMNTVLTKRIEATNNSEQPKAEGDVGLLCRCLNLLGSLALILLRMIVKEPESVVLYMTNTLPKNLPVLISLRNLHQLIPAVNLSLAKDLRIKLRRKTDVCQAIIAEVLTAYQHKDTSMWGKTLLRFTLLIHTSYYGMSIVTDTIIAAKASLTTTYELLDRLVIDNLKNSSQLVISFMRVLALHHEQVDLVPWCKLLDDSYYADFASANHQLYLCTMAALINPNETDTGKWRTPALMNVGASIKEEGLLLGEVILEDLKEQRSYNGQTKASQNIAQRMTRKRRTTTTNPRNQSILDELINGM